MGQERKEETYMAKAAQKKTDVVAAQSTAEVPKAQGTENANEQTPRLINQPKEVTALASSQYLINFLII